MGIYGIEINKNSEISVRRQIYQSLRDGILNGLPKGGEPLPSTRELAINLGISRNTVSEAYDMLITEGYAISRQGAPTRVAEGLYIEKSRNCSYNHVFLSSNRLWATGTNPPIEKPNIFQSSPKYKLTADFHTGRPDLRCFPRFLWQQLGNKVSERMPIELYGYSGPQGLAPLRKEISEWLFRSRGIIAAPENIFITAGATHALHLIADLLCADGRGVIMEDPCHTGMLQTFLLKGCPVIPVPADEQGMQTELLEANMKASAIYVTPSHQFPLGGILPANRRAALINYAESKDMYIIEDDYDSEFRYCGDPVAPLYTMDTQRVIYVGTFSKIIFPALRIGYVILPEKLHKSWKELRTYTDVQNPSFEQAVLAEFLALRKLDKHIGKMRKIYAGRRTALLEALSTEFGSTFRVFGDAAGLHVSVEFNGRIFGEDFKGKALQQGIYITPMENHCIQKGLHQNQLLLGYGHLEPEEIKMGGHMLHNFIMNYKQ